MIDVLKAMLLTASSPRTSIARETVGTSWDRPKYVEFASFKMLSLSNWFSEINSAKAVASKLSLAVAFTILLTAVEEDIGSPITSSIRSLTASLLSSLPGTLCSAIWQVDIIITIALTYLLVETDLR
jgi:hypothetical protein